MNHRSTIRLNLIVSMLAASIFFFASCDQQQKRSHSGGEREVTQQKDRGYKPGSSGQPFEVMVIGDKIQERPGLQKQIDSTFNAVFPALPQPESWFITNYVNAENFDKIHRRHKSLLFVSALKDDDRTNALVAQKMFSQKELQGIANKSAFSIDHKWDVYAKPQIAVFLSAPSKKSLRKQVFSNRSRLIKLFDLQEDRTMKEKLYSSGNGQITMNEQLKNGMGFHFKVPVGYKKAKLIGNKEASEKLKQAGVNAFAWFRLDTDGSIQNVMAYTRPYEGDNMIRKNYALQARNEVTKAFVDGPAEASYMQIENRYQPESGSTKINGLKAREYRGLWRMEGAQMGGPFVHYAIHDKAKDRVIYLDGFVYAAGEKKKPFVKRVETILKTLQIKKEG